VPVLEDEQSFSVPHVVHHLPDVDVARGVHDLGLPDHRTIHPVSKDNLSALEPGETEAVERVGLALFLLDGELLPVVGGLARSEFLGIERLFKGAQS
jgi:hypothetical protein